MANLRELTPHLKGKKIGSHEISWADDFRYVDPVDHSITEHQGIRVIFSDEARIIFRVSGTTTDTATLRVYLEAREGDPARQRERPQDVLVELASAATQFANIEEMTGRREPSLVT